MSNNYEAAVDWVKTRAYTDSLGSGFGFHEPIPCDEYDSFNDILGPVSRPSRLKAFRSTQNGVTEEDVSNDVTPEEGELDLKKGAGGRDSLTLNKDRFFNFFHVIQKL